MNFIPIPPKLSLKVIEFPKKIINEEINCYKFDLLAELRKSKFQKVFDSVVEYSNTSKYIILLSC